MNPRKMSGFNLEALDEELISSQLREVFVQYQALAASNPLELRAKIPSREIWRFFITKNNQQNGRGLAKYFPQKIMRHKNLTIHKYLSLFESFSQDDFLNIPKNSVYLIMKNLLWDIMGKDLKIFTFQDLLNLDYGWVPYEINEPGYLKSLYYSFDTIFDDQALTIDVIQEMHDQCIQYTKNVRCTSLFHKIAHLDDQSKFREKMTKVCLLFDMTSSKEGIREILAKQALHEYKYLRLRIAFEEAELSITSQVLDALNNTNGLEGILLDNLFLSESYRREYHPFLLKNINAIRKKLQSKELAQAIVDISQMSEFTVGLHSLPRGRMQDKLSFLLDKYNANIAKSQNAFEKLMAITIFIQDCAQLAPFAAANGRLFCMIILNKLLIRNGFPLAILDEQNEFMGYSTAQLMFAVIKGMNNTFELIMENELFNVKTSDIDERLKLEKFSHLREYFDELEEIENDFRKKSCTHGVQSPSSMRFFRMPDKDIGGGCEDRQLNNNNRKSF